MALTAITKFFSFKPHLSNRFTCCLYVGGTTVKEYLQFAVQSVQFTELESNASDAAVYFGNGYVTVPILNTASRKLNITFEETNTMEVSYILDSIMASHFHGTPRVVAIGIREYDDRFINVHSSKLYYCLLSGWDEPQFSRSGNPGVVTVSATFNVMSEEIWNGSAPTKESLGYVKIETLKDADKRAEAIAKIEEPTRRIMSDEEFAKWSKEFDKKSKTPLKMTVEQYLDYKYTAEHKIQQEIERRIAKGDKTFEKHVGENGAVFYTVKKSSDGKNLNRADNNRTKAEDDVMMHTVGSIMTNLNTVTKSMSTGGESMVLFSNFAIVKEESFSNGRVYSAAASDDRVGDGVNSHMFGIERNTGSGIFDNKKKSGVIHQTDRNVQLIGDWRNDAKNSGISLTKTAEGSDKQISMGYTNAELDVMAAVFSEMNRNGTGKYNFDDAKVYGAKTVKENRERTLTASDLAGGTVIAGHDSVSNKGKNGEAGVDTLRELQQGLAARMEGGKIDREYYANRQ